MKLKRSGVRQEVGGRAVAVLAVLPDYRSSFVSELRSALAETDTNLTIVAGDEHLDASVKSAPHDGVISVRNRALLGRSLLWQVGALRYLRDTDVAVVDLNPRSLTAWIVLITRKARRRRTLVWGHILPRRGVNAHTAPLRRRMRRLADGVISYTWSDADIVTREDPDVPVWVAANGLYREVDLGFDEGGRGRFRMLYVGRIEPSKKPLLALEAFAIACNELDLEKSVRLTFVGRGSQLPALRQRAQELGLAERVDILGSITDYERLRRLYGETIASLSPGYVGLSLTQSLGFGVPMVVGRDEPHAPEIELLSSSTGRTFPGDDAHALGAELVWCSLHVAEWDRKSIVNTVRSRYSSTAMARGFEMALRGVEQRDAR